MKTTFALALGACLTATSALAGVCPEDQILTEAREIGTAPDVGVERPILQEVDLTGWRGMGSFHLRMRRLTVAAHGTVPTHEHTDRPSIVLVQSGEIVEHNEYCAVPIVHKAGESAAEFGPKHSHWWENLTNETVVLISTDVIPVAMAQEPTMDMP